MGIRSSFLAARDYERKYTSSEIRLCIARSWKKTGQSGYPRAMSGTGDRINGHRYGLTHYFAPFMKIVIPLSTGSHRPVSPSVRDHRRGPDPSLSAPVTPFR